MPAVRKVAGKAETVNEDNRQCRICLETGDGVSTLIRPCKCKGTGAYVHVGCLNTWREKSGASKNVYQCGVCQFKYEFAGKDLYHVVLEHPRLTPVLSFFMMIFLVSVGAEAFCLASAVAFRLGLTESWDALIFNISIMGISLSWWFSGVLVVKSILMYTQ